MKIRNILMILAAISMAIVLYRVKKYGWEAKPLTKVIVVLSPIVLVFIVVGVIVFHELTNTAL